MKIPDVEPLLTRFFQTKFVFVNLKKKTLKGYKK